MLVSVPSTKREVFVKVAIEMRPPLTLTNTTEKMSPSDRDSFTADMKSKASWSSVTVSLHASAVVFVVQLNTAGSSRQIESVAGLSVTATQDERTVLHQCFIQDFILGGFLGA